MSSRSRYSLISVHVDARRKGAFAALASSRGLSEAALLSLMIDAVLADNPVEEGAVERSHRKAERTSVRLRTGDHRRIAERASARGMRLATYLTMLVGAHVRRDPPLPSAELDTIKAVVNRLAGLDRHLQRLAGADEAAELAALLQITSARVSEARRAVADVVRANLISWETPDA